MVNFLVFPIPFSSHREQPRGAVVLSRMNRKERRVRGYALFCTIYREFESSERDGIIYHVILVEKRGVARRSSGALSHFCTLFRLISRGPLLLPRKSRPLPPVTRPLRVAHVVLSARAIIFSSAPCAEAVG